MISGTDTLARRDVGLVRDSGRFPHMLGMIRVAREMTIMLVRYSFGPGNLSIIGAMSSGPRAFKLFIDPIAAATWSIGFECSFLSVARYVN